MFLIIITCFSAIMAASANNLIPVQMYQTYQQNGYTNPPDNPINNFQLYPQGVTAQNQMQQLNIAPSSIKQAVLNKLLSNPTVQTVLDPIAARYGSNLVGVQNNQFPVNSVNNYVGVPTDYLQNNTGYANIERKSNDSTRNTENGKQHKRKRSKPRRKQNEKQKIESTSNKNANIKDIHTTNRNLTEHDKKSRKNTRISKSDTEKDVESDKNSNTKRRKIKRKDQTTQNPIIEDNKDQNKKPRRRHKNQKHNETNEVNDVTIKPIEIKENLDLDITDNAMNNENRRTRNLNQGANDLLKIIPNTPKEMTSNFLSNLNKFNNPLMTNWFANYENLYQSLMTNPPTTTEVALRRRRKPKKNKKPKRKLTQSKNNTDVPSIAVPNISNIDSTTTERIVYVNHKTEMNVNSNPTEQSVKSIETDDKIQKLSNNEIFQDGYNINEFQERYDPGIYGGYIDDYYPMFTDSAAYNANNKEIILKNLNDNKYYYATDRIETDFAEQQPKLNNNDVIKQELIDIEKYKYSYDETEKESIKRAYEKDFEEKIEKELQFRSPPFLEAPDFRTRQIDRSEIRPEIYYTFDDTTDKTAGAKSSYSSKAKTPYIYGGKPNEIKQKRKDVETVYARSKVVSYGPVYSHIDNSLTASNDDYDPWIDFQDGGTTYVIAKSLDNPDLYT